MRDILYCETCGMPQPDPETTPRVFHEAMLEAVQRHELARLRFQVAQEAGTPTRMSPQEWEGMLRPAPSKVSPALRAVAGRREEVAWLCLLPLAERRFYLGPAPLARLIARYPEVTDEEWAEVAR